MTSLRFDGHGVCELLKHTRSCAEHVKPYELGVDPGPGLILVKETDPQAPSSTYLMSNGVPRLFQDEAAGDLRHKRVYASFAGVIEEEDFAEFIPDDDDLQKFIPEETLVIQLSEGSMRIDIETPAISEKLKKEKANECKPNP